MSEEKEWMVPIGVEPRRFYEEKVMNTRLSAICGAIVRYYEARLPIKIEWVEEYNELIVKYNQANPCKSEEKPDMSFGW